MSKVWLVTGSGNGLGRAIAEAVLERDDRLVATARKPEELQDLVAQYGDRMRTVALDVTDEAAAKSAVELAVAAFGRLDVLVNNAGFGLFSPFEQMAPADFQAVMDTCFYGVVYTTRAAIPIMRKQRSGWILQISSVGGRITVPGNTPYHAAKWAVGGFSEALAAEVAPFGVKVCTVEPGGIRTSWARRARQNVPELLPEYEASVGAIFQLLQSLIGREESDPKKIAQALLKLTDSESTPKRLVLGVDAANRLKQWEDARRQEAEEWRWLTESTVAEERVAVPELEASSHAG
jgi:NAD(P)-dependent dehydrogenase (short-subunit alcohol dehydrogenase family)